MQHNIIKSSCFNVCFDVVKAIETNYYDSKVHCTCMYYLHNIFVL